MTKRLGGFIFVLAITPGVAPAASAAVREDFQDLANSIAVMGRPEAAARITGIVDGFSDAELEEAYGEVDLGKLAAAFQASAAAMAALPEASPLRSRLNQPPEASRSADLPDASDDYPSVAVCAESPIRRAPDSSIDATIVIGGLLSAVDVASDVAAAASRGCDQLIVAIGVGANGSLICLPFDIAVATARGILSIAESALAHTEACDAAIDSAEIAASYRRLEHIDTDLATHDADIKTILATLGAKIDGMQETIDLLAKTQLEQAAQLLGGSRMGVIYTDRLGEFCANAQEAITDTLALGYSVSGEVQAIHDEGVALMATDPKAAHDLCRQAYKLATRGSSLRR